MKKRNKKEESPIQKSEDINPVDPVNRPSGDNLFDDDELPGYPHYPSSEDIMNPGNNMEKKELSEENFSQTGVPAASEKNKKKPAENKSEPTDIEREEEEAEAEDENSEADISREDLLALGNDELNMDEGDDELLKKRSVPVDMTGDDLDVPGSELDDEDEMIGEEDEENNSYSIGGDRHEDLEENGRDSDDKF